MVTKTALLTTFQEVLSTYFTDRGTKATIEVLERLNMKELRRLDEVSPEVVDICILSLFERVRMLKGNDVSIRFLQDMNGNEVFQNRSSLQDLLTMEKMASRM